jgi:hypothetical protein
LQPFLPLLCILSEALEGGIRGGWKGMLTSAAAAGVGELGGRVLMKCLGGALDSMSRGLAQLTRQSVEFGLGFASGLAGGSGARGALMGAAEGGAESAGEEAVDGFWGAAHGFKAKDLRSDNYAANPKNAKMEGGLHTETLANGAVLIYIDPFIAKPLRDLIIQRNLQGFFVDGHGLAGSNVIVEVEKWGDLKHWANLKDITAALKAAGHQEGQPVTLTACFEGAWQKSLVGDRMPMAQLMSDALKAPVIAADVEIFVRSPHHQFRFEFDDKKGVWWEFHPSGPNGPAEPTRVANPAP